MICHRRHTGKLKKRDKLPTKKGGEGEGRGRGRRRGADGENSILSELGFLIIPLLL
jgi:hypothetical protein